MKKGFIVAGVVLAVIVIIVLVARSMRTATQNPVNTVPNNNSNTQEPADPNASGYDAFMASCTSQSYGNTVASCNQAWCIAKAKGLTTWAQYLAHWNYCQTASSFDSNCNIPQACR